MPVSHCGKAELGRHAIRRAFTANVTVHPVVSALRAYVAKTSGWNNAAINDAGAVTLAGNCAFTGTLSSGNSVLGRVASQGSAMSFDFDPVRTQFIVGGPTSNLISLYAEGISCVGFE